MVRISYSKQVRDFIDAADVSGNIRNNKAAKDYLVHIDSAVQVIGRSKFKALYPFVGGVAGSHKFNYIDPRDLDAAYRLSFLGGWTHNASGSTPNGTTGYADTFFIPTITDNNGFGVYCGTNSVGNEVEINNQEGFPPYYLATRYLGDQILFSSDSTGSDVSATSITDARGFTFGNVNNTQLSIYKNGQSLGTATMTRSSTQITTSLILSARRQSGSVSTGFSNKRLQLVVFTKNSLSANEHKFFYHQIQFAQRILGRAV